MRLTRKLRRRLSRAQHAARFIVLALPVCGIARAEPGIPDPLASLQAYQECLRETADIPGFFAYIDTSLDQWCSSYGEAREQWIRDESPTVLVHAGECEAYGIVGTSPDACLPVSFAGATTVQVVVDPAADAGFAQRVMDAIHARGVQFLMLKAAVPE